MLRAFLADLVQEMGLREAGRLIERGREQVRKFVSGAIESPHARTREKLGNLLIDRQERGDRVAESLVQAPSPTPLKLILPKGLERATGEIRAMFALIRKQPGAPEAATGVEQWLLRHVKSEYSSEQAYSAPKRAAPRKRAAKGKAGE